MPAAGRRRPPRAILVPALLMAGVLVSTAACSNRESAAQKRPHTGSATASSVAGLQQVTVDAGSDLRFHPSHITVGSGKVKIVLHNTEPTGQGAPHNFDLVGISGAQTPDAQAGQTTSITFTAPAPGSYRFVCTFHAKLGQTGTLVVTK